MAEKFLLIFCAVSLSACSLSGVQYQPPTELQDSAKLTGSSLKIFNFSPDGCFSGMTAFDDNIKIHANKEVVIAFEAYPQTNFFVNSYSRSPLEKMRHTSYGKLLQMKEPTKAFGVRL